MHSRVISLHGKPIEADCDGIVTVSRRELQGVDLRQLPAETSLFVETHSIRHGTSVEVFAIDVRNPTGFSVLAAYRICPHCFGHALAYETFMKAVELRLREKFSGGDNYVSPDAYGRAISLEIHMTRSEHTVEEIEAAIRTEIDDALVELIDYANQIDQQIKEQFGV